MSEQNDTRNQWLHLRLTSSEYDQINRQFSKTTCRKLSDYARKMLLQKPIIASHRDSSLDDFMTEAIRLRKELNNIGNNFNQAVNKLHTLHQIAEFKSWITCWEEDKKALLKLVEEIKIIIQKTGEKWLQ